MRRPILLLAALIAATLTLTAAAAPSALAADPSCSIHQENVVSWDVQRDVVNTSWDFKCGGAFNDDWYLRVYLQYRDASGFWHTYPCDAMPDCSRLKPSSGGTFGAGEEHMGTDTWNVATNINCDYLRFHVVQVFANIGTNNYNTITYHIGGC